MVELMATQLDRLRAVTPIVAHDGQTLWLMRTEDDRQVAVKTLQTPLFALPMRTLFIQRLHVLLRLSHSRLAKVYAGRVRRPSSCVVVSDYFERGSLYDALAPGARRAWSLPLAPSEAVRLISEAAEGIAALHARQFIHGGLKPANMLLAPGTDGVLHVSLTDALLHHGILGYTGRDFQVRPQGLGDPLLFVAPEQYLGHTQLASDQYALAMIAFILLTGETPYTIDPIAMLQQPNPPKMRIASEANPMLPQELDAVLARALRRQARTRYRTVPEFADALRLAVRASLSVRSVQIAPETPGATTIARRQAGGTALHESVELPVPLALLGGASDGNQPGMPALPPSYHWTEAALASMPLPVVQPDVPVARRRKSGHGMLVAFVVVVWLLIIALVFASVLLWRTTHIFGSGAVGSGTVGVLQFTSALLEPWHHGAA